MDDMNVAEQIIVTSDLIEEYHAQHYETTAICLCFRFGAYKENNNVISSSLLLSLLSQRRG